MYCKYCGKEINDDADVCIHCGRSTGVQNTQYTQNQSQPIGEPKTGIGILLGLFLGIIGLIIGLLLYPANTLQRSTFLKGWGWTIAVVVIIAIIGAASANR